VVLRWYLGGIKVVLRWYLGGIGQLSDTFLSKIRLRCIACNEWRSGLSHDEWVDQLIVSGEINEDERDDMANYYQWPIKWKNVRDTAQREFCLFVGQNKSPFLAFNKETITRIDEHFFRKTPYLDHGKPSELAVSSDEMNAFKSSIEEYLSEYNNFIMRLTGYLRRTNQGYRI